MESPEKTIDAVSKPVAAKIYQAFHYHTKPMQFVPIYKDHKQFSKQNHMHLTPSKIYITIFFFLTRTFSICR